MKKKDFNANVAYLEEQGVYIDDCPAWEERPFSRCLCYNTPCDGDFSIVVEELTREKVLEYLDSYDINEECLMWWNSGRTPFSNIRDLYNDIESWVEEFKEIAWNMPY